MKKITKIVLAVLAIPVLGWLYWEYGVKTSEQRYFESKIPDLIAAGEKGLPLKEMTNFDWDKGCLVAVTYGDSNIPPYYIIEGQPEKDINTKYLEAAGYQELTVPQSILNWLTSEPTEIWNLAMIDEETKTIRNLSPRINFPIPYSESKCFGNEAIIKKLGEKE